MVPGPGRTTGVPEWLDMIKQEFESLSHEAMIAKAQRDECEHKSMFANLDRPRKHIMEDIPVSWTTH